MDILEIRIRVAIDISKVFAETRLDQFSGAFLIGPLKGSHSDHDRAA